MRREFRGFDFELTQDGTIVISQRDPIGNDDAVIQITLDDAQLLLKCLQDALDVAEQQEE